VPQVEGEVWLENGPKFTKYPLANGKVKRYELLYRQIRRRHKAERYDAESRFLTPELPALGASQPEMSVFGWIPGSNRMRR
jgi:hypothetical protein